MIDVKSDDAEVQLFVSYIVYNASWSPKYDIRVFTKEKTMTVNKKIVKLFDFWLF